MALGMSGNGLELSHATHINWVPNDGTPITGTPPAGGATPTRQCGCIDAIRAAGGAACYNHMFGATPGPLITGTARTDKMRTTATQLLAKSALCRGHPHGWTIETTRPTLGLTVTHEGCSGMTVKVFHYAISVRPGGSTRRVPLMSITITPGSATSTSVTFTNANSYVRTEVWAGGSRVAFSNPIYITRR
ncbi:hypothetical protein BN11_3670004 [Nostocoides australiense Ben110]|uniref:Uncharacterized protein n=2 Tax=Nostocoides australiense TaxID=99480 RepID=W6JWU2_9MICO|nr:hypothetical protein BN11_3670004 [Tetrasphaera australiensis Ben110]